MDEDLIVWLADVLWDELLGDYIPAVHKTAVMMELEVILQEAMPDFIANMKEE